MLSNYISNATFQKMGFYNELDFWKNTSTSNSQTITDNMVSALSRQGYSGTPHDMLRQWLQDTTKISGTLGDCARELANTPVSVPGLTFYKDFTSSNNGLSANYSKGASTATFTATRSASAPATYIDKSGVIQLVTTSNVPRYVGGYYDDTGYHATSGVLIEGSRTNLLTRTDGTAYANGKWSGWQSSSPTLSGTPTYTTPDNTALINIPGTTYQRVEYVGLAGDANVSVSNLIFKSTNTSVGSVAPGDVVSVSVLYKGEFTGLTASRLNLNWREADGSLISSTQSTFTTQSNWTLLTIVGTAPANSSLVSVATTFTGIDEGDIIDLSMCRINVEVAPYASSFIPTTTAALTRGAEVLKYEIAGNRTAASESVFISFSPISSFANDGTQRYLTTTDTKTRNIVTSATANQIIGRPNSTDSSGCSAVFTPTTITSNVKQVITLVVSHVVTYAELYLGGATQNKDTTDDFIDNAWGTSFYIGMNTNAASNAFCVFHGVTIFNKTMTAPEVLAVSNYLA